MMIIGGIYVTLLIYFGLAYPKDPLHVPVIFAGIGTAFILFWWLMLQPLLGIQTGGVLS